MGQPFEQALRLLALLAAAARIAVAYDGTNELVLSRRARSMLPLVRNHGARSDHPLPVGSKYTGRGWEAPLLRANLHLQLVLARR
jgi:hypothetical protein